MENELRTLTNGLFDHIENKKLALRKEAINTAKFEQLEIVESDASALASFIPETVKKGDKAIQDFKKTVNDIKKVVDEI